MRKSKLITSALVYCLHVIFVEWYGLSLIIFTCHAARTWRAPAMAPWSVLMAPQHLGGRENQFLKGKRICKN
jgi:hypothetical protein